MHLPLMNNYAIFSPMILSYFFNQYINLEASFTASYPLSPLTTLVTNSARLERGNLAEVQWPGDLPKTLMPSCISLTQISAVSGS